MFQIMYYTGLVFTSIFLVLSIVFFVKNNVAKLIGDVTGWNARKAIKEINKKGAEEKSKTQAIKSEVSKVLVREEHSSGKLRRLEEKSGEEGATLLQTGDEETAVLAEEETTLLQAGEEETAVLAEEETTLLQTGDEETAVLAEEETTLLQTGEEETAVLAEEETTLLQTGDEETAVLAEEETTLLQTGDEETAVLAEEETTLLQAGEEETSVWRENEISPADVIEETSVVVADESTSILNQVMDYTAVTAKPKKQKPVIMSDDEQIPIPDIFEVEEDAMVVHTDESIG